MDFPEIKRKKYAPKIDSGAPFPILTGNNSERKPIGYFTGCSVEIFNENNIQLLHKNGVFGKGLLSRSTPACLKPQKNECKKLTKAQFDNRQNLEKFIGNLTKKETFEVDDEFLETIHIEEPLILSLEEGFFLQYSLKCLEVQNLSNQILETKDLWIKFCNLNKNFVTSYVTYQYLRSLNWVVRNGFQFGGDFLLYKSGPQFYHATYIVYIKNSNEEFNSLHFQGLSRIAETSAKDLLVIEVFYPKNVSATNYEECFNNLSSFRISEYSPKRFLYNQAK